MDSTTNIQYDTVDRPVTVTLSLDGSKLKAEVNYGDKGVPVFINTKTPPPPPEKPPHDGSTGDSAVFLPYILLMLLSMMAAGVVIYNRRRRNS